MAVRPAFTRGPARWAAAAWFLLSPEVPPEGPMHFLDAWTLAEVTMELVLGVCIKLFCDNGRIHWRDLVNDFLFWVPGVRQLPADGLTRAVATAIPAPAVADEVPVAAAAK